MRFNMPTNLTSEEKNVVYEKLFGLIIPTSNYSKVVWHLKRFWIHLSGRLDNQAIDKLNKLSNDQLFPLLSCLEYNKNWTINHNVIKLTVENKYPAIDVNDLIGGLNHFDDQHKMLKSLKAALSINNYPLFKQLWVNCSNLEYPKEEGNSLLIIALRRLEDNKCLKEFCSHFCWKTNDLFNTAYPVLTEKNIGLKKAKQLLEIFDDKFIKEMNKSDEEKIKKIIENFELESRNTNDQQVKDEYQLLINKLKSGKNNQNKPKKTVVDQFDIIRVKHEKLMKTSSEEVPKLIKQHKANLLKFIKENKQEIRGIDLTSCQCLDQNDLKLFLESLAKCPNLEELSIHTTKLDGIDSLKNLKELELIYTKNDHNDENFDFSTLAKLQFLERLTINGKGSESNNAQITPQHLQQLGTIRNLKDLSFLNIPYIDLGETEENFVDKFLMLECFEIYDNKCIKGLNKLVNFPQLKSLELCFSDSKIKSNRFNKSRTVETLVNLKDLKDIEKLEKLVIENSKEITNLEELENFKRLRKIKLTNCSSKVSEDLKEKLQRKKIKIFEN